MSTQFSRPCYEHNIHLIDTRHEAAATHVADGFVWTTGRPVTAVATPGPAVVSGGAPLPLKRPRIPARPSQARVPYDLGERRGRRSAVALNAAAPANDRTRPPKRLAFPIDEPPVRVTLLPTTGAAGLVEEGSLTTTATA